GCTVRDIVRRGRSDWIAAMRRELQRLEPRAEWSELAATIERDLPSVSVRLFERCLDAFLSGASRWRICVLTRALTLGLRPFARPPALDATPRAIAARLAGAVGLPAPVEGKGLVTGGRVLALGGGVVIAERYPIPANYALCGPSEEQGVQTRLDTRVARLLRRVEWTYYEWMRPPDATIVLQLDPEVAVRRKTDEPEDYVRERVQI